MTILLKKHYLVQYFITRGISAIVAACLVCVPVVTMADPYDVKNESELLTVLTSYPADNDKIINLSDNVLVANGQVFDIGDAKVTLNLNVYNFQGAGSLVFKGNAGSEININGSTTAFNGGMHLEGEITWNQNGNYTSSAADIFGKDTADDVKINFINPGSDWNARTPNSQYIGSLRPDVTDYEKGTIIVGYEGKAVMDIGAGNWVRNAETIVGAKATGIGELSIKGEGTNWRGTGTFYIGYEGTGTVNVTDGARLDIGSIEIGKVTGADGTLKVSASTVNIFGRNDHPGQSIGNIAPSDPLYEDPGYKDMGGDGGMFIENRSIIRFDRTLTETGLSSGFPPRLAIGTGTSTIDNSYMHMVYGYINGEENAMTFEKKSYLEGTQYEKQSNGNYDKRGTFFLKSLTFNSGAVLSPGFGNLSLWENETELTFTTKQKQELYKLAKDAGDTGTDNSRFGLFYVDNSGTGGDLTIEDTGFGIFDFDVQGNSEHDEYLQEHKDYVELANNKVATINGHLHFRPMTGYFTDDIKIQFMSNSNATTNYTIWPERWFINDTVDNGILSMTRNQTPFTGVSTSGNEFGVGGALDAVYNQRQQSNKDDELVQQKEDEWFPVLDWFWALDNEQTRETMHELAGEQRAASFFMPVRSPWNYGFDRVNWRKRDYHVYFGQQNTLSAQTANNGIWASAYFDTLNAEADGNTSRVTIARTAFMVGYDRALSPHTAVGALFGYSHPELEQRAASVAADDWLFGVYGGTRILDDYELKFWGGYGHQNYDSTRKIVMDEVHTLRANYSGNAVTGSVNVARPFGFRNGLLRPFAELDLSYIQQNGASERGNHEDDHAIALNYKDSDWTQLFGRIGLRADYGWEKFAFTGSLTYAYQVAGDVEPVSTNQFQIDTAGTTFNVKGNNMGRSFISLGLGTQIHLNKEKSRMLFVHYKGDYGDGANNQTAAIGLQMAF
jgi:T5SS/PEP-CTERM-associated repeat protein